MPIWVSRESIRQCERYFQNRSGLFGKPGFPASGLRLQKLDLCRGYNRLFENLDVLITPTQRVVPSRLDEQADIMSLTRVFNMTGQPAVSVPAGQVGHLLVGLQLVGHMGRDFELLLSADRIRHLLGS